jgi:hypothetical protein
MTTQLDELLERLRSVEAEIEAELTKRREELRFHLENRRIVFEQEVLRIHRELKTRATRYLIDANPLMILTAPVIYSLIVPITLLDLFVMAYQAICFPICRIPKVRPAAITWSSTAIISPISTSSRRSIAPIAPTPTARSRLCARWRRAPRSIGARSSMPAGCSVRTRTIRVLRILATPKRIARSSRR